MQELDPRIVRITIIINGRSLSYDNLNLSAAGTKYANANQNECEIKLTNLNKTDSDFILTETSPYNLNKTPKIAIVEAGRKSYGVSRIFSGNIASAVASQPPDTTIILKCLTGNFQKGNLISRNQPGRAKLSDIAKTVASDLGVVLGFEAVDKNIANYTYTGASLKQVERLGEAGRVNAYIDDEMLIVKDMNAPLSNRVRILNLETGLIGIPEFTEEGVKAKFLLDNQTVLGGALRLQSKIYPAVNGDYTIFKLSFEITNRDIPFYWIAEAKRR